MGDIRGCYASGAVTGDEYIGGLLGCNEGAVMNCYATGTVSGSYYIAGLATPQGQRQRCSCIGYTRIPNNFLRSIIYEKQTAVCIKMHTAVCFLCLSIYLP
ncbi:MAG: GLUG motif-containing protein [Tepidanaerobacteraceae bacterium]